MQCQYLVWVCLLGLFGPARACWLLSPHRLLVKHKGLDWALGLLVSALASEQRKVMHNLKHYVLPALAQL